MRQYFAAAIAVFFSSQWASGNGLLIPDDPKLPPLAMVFHRVQVSIEDQVAVTTVEQAFRNHTDRPLEATYVFPVPRGASVNRFSMVVDGKEMHGEMLDADKARQIYTDIVRRTQDPGLLEYFGNNLMRLRVFPIVPKSDQKITLRFTSIAPSDSGVVEYVYPIKTDGKATQTLQDFSVKLSIRTQQPLSNIYSPTHAISIRRDTDRTAEVVFERNQAVLDKDFQLYYSVGSGEVGFTPLTYRPISTEDGYFLFLIRPQISSNSARAVPRDVVFVLDTSGSMAGIKMDQAKKAVRQCLDQVGSQDRFAVINFSTTIGKYRDALVDASREQIENAKKWVAELRTSGGTAIDDALREALALRTDDTNRTFTVVFLTDGQPTIGEVNPEKILKRFAAKNTANTRVFTFGVGDDVNATLLDQLSEQSRAESAYVRPAEDIEAKASSLYSKVSHPVLTNLSIATGDSVRLSEVYPPQLPDLFVGSELVVVGRYSGSGATTVRLRGSVGGESREYTYEVPLPAKSGEPRDFVEHLWGRRKVGYLLDQIRANGEKKELIEDVVSLAKKFGIATPYTSYLIVPDSAMPVARGLPVRPISVGGGAGVGNPPALRVPGAATAAPQTVVDFARQNQIDAQLAKTRNKLEEIKLKSGNERADERKILADAASKKEAFDDAKAALSERRVLAVQSGKLGVDLSVESANLKNQRRISPSATRNVAGRNCLEIGGIWIDDGYDAKMKTVTVKAQSPAYFRILERQPKVKDVFRLGNYLLWVTPNGTALVVDTEGKEQLTDAEIDSLFAVAK
jgi:Ca-activated chloride channel family protein